MIGWGCHIPTPRKVSSREYKIQTRVIDRKGLAGLESCFQCENKARIVSYEQEHTVSKTIVPCLSMESFRKRFVLTKQ